MPKRYYWLKLKDDFFGSKRIKKLRNMAGGDTYVIIYLKMQLLAMKTDGVLTWTGLEEDFADELALDLDEKPNDVEVTLFYLLKTGLAETHDNQHFFFPYAIENTGCETAAAQRMRDMRERNKVTESRNNVIHALQDSYGEKEIEKDIEREKEREEETRTPARLKKREDEKDDGFQTFWMAYPKQSGDIRQAYMEYISALAGGAKKEELLSAALSKRENTPPEDYRYIPSAEKWLRNKGWLEKEPPKPPKHRSYTTAEEYAKQTKTAINTDALAKIEAIMAEK